MKSRDLVTLLDVNVLIALFDPAHIHHEPAHTWFARHGGAGWATCPITENALVRILSNPAYPGRRTSLDDAIHRLDRFCASGHHVFWSEEQSIRDADLFRPVHIGGHRQITDVYLLALAVRRGGRLVTFDRTIPERAVAGATRDNLVVIS